MTLSRIFIAGHRGMVGSAIHRLLQTENNDVVTKNRAQLDLSNAEDVRRFFSDEKIDQVYLAAAKVGGIHANNIYPADFIASNLSIQLNIIQSAFHTGVQKLLFLGSSCIYPKFAKQPISEDMLLSGALEPTNEPYAIAKIAGIKLCESFNRQHGTSYRSVTPTNLYGPGDNFHPENSHVIPALMQRIHNAKLNKEPIVTIWGTGSPKREFLHVDDMAKACIHVMNLNKDVFEKEIPETCSHINVGTGVDVSIAELAKTICGIIGYEGRLVFDTKKPDGTPVKLLDVSRLEKLGWDYNIPLKDGLYQTYQWFLKNVQTLRR